MQAFAHTERQRAASPHWPHIKSHNSANLQGQEASAGHGGSLRPSQLLCRGASFSAVPYAHALQLPAGAKILAAADRVITVAPLGHVIEQDYTVYLRFNA